ncbi:hypothetical protein FHX42_000374 [Saccharopolyspora lacisalsi]|uniref:Uncharacterized protein n=1 Tax=Halosaccharopolyspora lacisalsi TaxID=1000566 RepID=A0A839DUT7_9PSEU|nr:hypothetical protein [Halosaccharopolyspora lacisalsi]MBA8823045.1 hypothetical protein [Halosaccharopolyspora lacisalsi]
MDDVRNVTVGLLETADTGRGRRQLDAALIAFLGLGEDGWGMRVDEVPKHYRSAMRAALEAAARQS